jgi:SEC-C motif-containing protein
MRSRFAAFALKEIEYLWRTLHADHEDRARPKDEVVREIREACTENRYLGLRILDATPPDAEGVARVLFAARVFRRGQDLSFAECSDFRRDESGWRYVSGVAAPVAMAEAAPTVAAFLAAV